MAHPLGQARKDGGTGFVDLHSHVLPGVDDGPQQWEEAVQMLRRAAQAGTTHMVATPHSDGRAKWDSVDSLRALCRDMNRALESEGVALALTLGMENPLELDTADKLERGAALTLNGSPYVLVELPFQLLPSYWEEALFQLQLKGFRPIIAHPERQAQIQNNPQLLTGPVGRGVLSQVTAGSLSGRFGSRAKKTAEILCKRELVQVISSDCHGLDGARSPDIRDGLEAAARLVGKEKAARMAFETPRAMIHAAK